MYRVTPRSLRRLAIGALPLFIFAACGSDGGEDEAVENDTSVSTEADAPEVFSSCASATDPEGGALNLGAVINMIDFEYCQPDVTVGVGEVVEFVNNGEARHQVEQAVEAGVEEAFRSDALLSGDEFVLTLDTPGTYEYICSFHSELMTGQITVE